MPQPQQQQQAAFTLPDELRCSSIVDACLCPSQGTWHKQECVTGQCSVCGPDKLNFDPIVSLIPLSKLRTHRVQFRQYMRVKHGDSERLELVMKDMTVDEFLEYFVKETKKFLAHDALVKWQQYQWQQAKEQQQPHELLGTMDFAENFTALFDKEAQSTYWARQQVSLFVFIAHVMYPGKFEAQLESHLFWSDDRKHDSAFAQLCVQKVMVYYKDKGLQIKVLMLFSDGGPAHFKQADAFYAQTLCMERLGVPVARYFYASSHGKGLHDGEGGRAKRAVEQANNTNDDLVLTDSAAIVHYMSANDKQPWKALHPSEAVKQQIKIAVRVHHDVTAAELKAARAQHVRAHTVEGTRMLHELVTTGAARAVLVRNLACCCMGCRQWAAGEQEYGQCESSQVVGKHEAVRMLEVGQSAQYKAGEARIKQLGVAQAAVGSLLGVQTDPGTKEGNIPYDYFLFQVTEKMHEVQETVRGGTYTIAVGQEGIKGHYLEVDGDPSNLKFKLEKAVNWVRPARVIATNVPHSKAGSVFQLSKETDKKLKQASGVMV